MSDTCTYIPPHGMEHSIPISRKRPDTDSDSVTGAIVLKKGYKVSMPCLHVLEGLLARPSLRVSNLSLLTCYTPLSKAFPSAMRT